MFYFWEVFMLITHVSEKGQVVIPAEFREKFGIKKGTSVKFFEKDGEIRMVPMTKDLIRKNCGILGTKGKLLKLLAEEKKVEREL
jgi:AbrB family looped-hinge helix DNA binding protein